MPTDDAQKLFKALNPLSCEQVCQWLADWTRDALDAEHEEEIREHVLVCDACALAFAEVIEQQVDTGALPLQQWPSHLPFPSMELFAAAPADMPAPRVVAATLPAAVREAFGILWEEGKQAARAGLARAQEALAEGRRGLESAMALWRLGFADQGANLGGALPAMGEARGPIRFAAQVFDEHWQPHDGAVFFTVAAHEGPLVTVDGHFTLTLHTAETQWYGAPVVCTLQLVEGKRLSFASVVTPDPAGTGGIVHFDATDLPQGTADVPVPLDYVSLALQSMPKQTA